MKISVFLSTASLFLFIHANAFAMNENECESTQWSEITTSQLNTHEKIKDTNTAKETEIQTYIDKAKLTLELDSKTIKLGQPFSFKVTLCDDKQVKPERVTADAIMPAHQHGMNYTPTIRYEHETNSYVISDFLFHMPGEWEITVSSYYSGQVTHFTKLITVN